MKIYHLSVLLHSGTNSFTENFKITADKMEASNAGFYYFVLNGEVIAYFPIANTSIPVIEKIVPPTPQVSQTGNRVIDHNVRDHTEIGHHP